MTAKEAFAKMPESLIVRYGPEHKQSVVLQKALNYTSDLAFYNGDNVWAGEEFTSYYITVWRDDIEGKQKQPSEAAYNDMLTAKIEIARMSASHYFERHPPGEPFIKLGGAHNQAPCYGNPDDDEVVED